MKTITLSYTLQTNGKKLAVSLSALFRAVGLGGEVTAAEIPGEVLDTLRVRLVSPGTSGAVELSQDANKPCYYTLEGSNLLLTLSNMVGGVHRLTVLVKYGTNTRALLLVDLSVPQNIQFLKSDGAVLMPLIRKPELDTTLEGVNWYGYAYLYGKKIAWLQTDKPLHVRGTIPALYAESLETEIGNATAITAIVVQNAGVTIFDETPAEPITFGAVDTVGGGAQIVTHAKLVEMRDNAQLVAGAWYRITDFVTTVANKDNARSAGHAFDILVRALDSSTLDENARAIKHAGDTYFAGCNLAAWELKYSIDNDAKRFSWADETNGKGVIWFMRDEWNNSKFYDFKNVQFKRWSVNEIQDENGNRLDDPTSTFAYANGTQDIRYGHIGENYIYGKYKFVIGDSNNFDWYYAFTWINANNEVKDATIVGQTLLNDEGFSLGVHDNNHGACFVRNSVIPEELMRDLDNGVDVATYTYGGGVFYGMYGTKTGNDCYSWTCGNNCSSWTCGNDCSFWTCGNGCYSWTCGNYCSFWTCGNDCYSWTCGNNCSFWTCGNNCYSWTCGNDCSFWTCGNDCNSWTCGNDCSSWTCGNGCYSWTCGNYCNSWTCGNGCYSWTCGNECNSWTCGNYCYYWTCGNECSNWTCVNYYRYFAIEDGVKYADISCAVTTSNSAYAQNILIHSGVNGNSDRHVTCEIATVNNDFLTEFGNVVQGTIS